MLQQNLTEAMKDARRQFAGMYDFLAETLLRAGKLGRYDVYGQPGKTGRNQENDSYLVRVSRNGTAVLSITLVAGGSLFLHTHYGSWTFQGDGHGYTTCQWYAWVLLNYIILDSFPGRLAA